jgi:lysyl endopeptidase
MLPRLCLLFLLGISAVTASAQVRTRIFPDSLPANEPRAKAASVRVRPIPPPRGFEELLKPDKTGNRQEYSNRFAVPKDVDLDVIKTGTIMEENGLVTYVLSLQAQKALNISLQFNEFQLSENSILSIYSRNELTDSITAKENNESRQWATRVYQGNRLTILLKVPAAEREAVSLRIGRIFFGFKKLGNEYFGNIGSSAACNINVACPDATGWDNERNSVAMIVSNNVESCTGSLVMNTCNTNRPFFLTANHCLNGNQANWVFQFQTWSTACATNTGWREDIQFNGATLRANNAATDFALLELAQIPPQNSGITYSGWSRSTTAPNGSVGLHHPAGDLMKFSRDFHTSGLSSWGGTNNHWVSVFEQGTVEYGSSGSPLYNMDHRIVGQLHGDQNNQNNFCSQRRGEYGRFDLSWTGGGTNATRLSNWLDPQNTGATTTNTTNISNLVTVRPADYSISGPSQFCTSGTYSIANLPAGATVQWYINSIYGLQSHSVSNNVLTLNRVSDGSAFVSAVITTCGSTISIPARTVQVGGSVITLTAWQTGCDWAQFNVSGAASGASYSWSSLGDIILYNGTSTTATTSGAQIDGMIAENALAYVTTTNTCGQTVTAGGDYNPYQRQIQGLYPEYIYGDHVSVSVNTTQYDTYYRWYINNTLVKEGSYASSYCTCYYEGPDARVCYDNSIRVEVDISCGPTSYAESNFFRICGYYRTQSNVELFPNPARDQVTVRLKQINAGQGNNQLKSIREVRILDKIGNVKRVLKYTPDTKSASINLAGLPLDIYFMEISDGVNTARVPLSIQK